MLSYMIECFLAGYKLTLLEGNSLFSALKEGFQYMLKEAIFFGDGGILSISKLNILSLKTLSFLASLTNVSYYIHSGKIIYAI